MFHRPVVLCLANCITVIVEMVEGRVRPAVRMLVSPAVDTRRTFRRGKSSRIVIMMTIQKSLREI